MPIIDCDVHVRWSSLDEIAPYFSEPWRSQLMKGRRPFGWNGYFNPLGSWRRDATPPEGGSPGSNPQFTVTDLVDRYGMDYVVLMGESSHLALSNLTNADWATMVAQAYNDWLIDRWLTVDERFLATMFVATQDPQRAADEISRVGSHPQIVQIGLGSGARAPYGQRYYDPVYEAAERKGLAVAIHVGTEGAGTSAPPTAAGYPSFYVEWKINHASVLQAHMVSMICEGTFERFPALKLVLVEGGVTWLPATLWRMDQSWRALRSEVPWLKRPPSAYAADHVRLTTQPLDEPENRQHLAQLLEMFPADRMLMFSTDYPHWDFDNPTVITDRIPAHLKDRVLSETAAELYGLPSFGTES